MGSVFFSPVASCSPPGYFLTVPGPGKDSRGQKQRNIRGSELDGRTIPYDNSLEGLLSKKKDFIGKRSLSRKAFAAEDRQKIVGVVPLDKKTSIPEGSHLVENKNAKLPKTETGEPPCGLRTSP